MGVPADDWPELARLATAAFAPNDSTFRLDPDPALSLKRTHARILGYFAALIDERTREPRDDALGAMVAASQTREPLLTRDDVVVNCLGLLLGAVVSVPRAASALIMQLGTTGSVREDWELPANIDPLVEELLRWSSPVAYFMRVAIVDVALGGHLVRAGEPVAAWIASANRDETVYSKPDAFLVDGRRARHLACGLGPHLCIGAPIARSALATFWREVSRRNVRVRIESAPRRIRSSFLNGYKEMPVSLT